MLKYPLFFLLFKPKLRLPKSHPFDDFPSLSPNFPFYFAMKKNKKGDKSSFLEACLNYCQAKIRAVKCESDDKHPELI
jgi:hypothetical protein